MRRVRETKVYSEVVTHDAATEEIKTRNPATLMLSDDLPGVYAEGTPKPNPKWLEPGILVFSIHYGFQTMVEVLDGMIAATDDREYGRM